MGDLLLKILGFIIGSGLFLGLIGFIVWVLVAIFRGDIYHCWLPWMPWMGGGSYKITGKITFGDSEKKKNCNQIQEISDQWLKVKVVPHRAPKKVRQSNRKPEWWRFLTEESIATLLEKHRRRKAMVKNERDEPWRK